MKTNFAANLAMILVVIGWLLCFYGAQPLRVVWVPDAQYILGIEPANLSLAVGVITLQLSLWLSGYAFMLARKRASVTMLACILPTVFILNHARAF